MKTLLCYIPFVGIKFVMSSIENRRNEFVHSAHFIGTALWQAVCIAAVFFCTLYYVCCR